MLFYLGIIILTVRQALSKGAEYLADITDVSFFESEIFLAKILNQPRSKLYTSGDLRLSLEQQERYQKYLDDRKTGKPLAYIINRKDFWELSLYVDENVLIPRSETELLVEEILKRTSTNSAKSVLDLGTGSGAIAVSLAYECSKWQITGSDQSGDALKIAHKNALKYKLDNISFIQGDWFVPFLGQRFDIIVSNPPYIVSDDPHFLGEIKFEPITALDGGLNGMVELEKIIVNASKYLNRNSLLIVEHGYDQGENVRSLIKMSGFKQIQSLMDLAGLERATLGYLS
ncbi:MAG: peptide chain release factor N(5)-glutamine methyltransferase [Legionellales bacterium]|nr:peptide chain release factor N(5)-glutamine methyltransferase [Legionellales bacterium]